MKKILFLLAPLFCLNAQVDLSYYLGDTSNYNQSIPTPESIIGHQVGELHVSHDKLSHYVQEVSKSSDRVKLVNRGKTYENRVSWLMIITSESNQSRLEEIRQNHLELSNSKNVDLLIRTGGEYRISNFLLWQISYAELNFQDVLWPDFKKKHFLNAIIDYQKRTRRFGKIEA